MINTVISFNTHDIAKTSNVILMQLEQDLQISAKSGAIKQKATAQAKTPNH